MFIDVFMMQTADSAWSRCSINIYRKEEKKGGRKKVGRRNGREKERE